MHPLCSTYPAGTTGMFPLVANGDGMVVDSTTVEGIIGEIARLVDRKWVPGIPDLAWGMMEAAEGFDLVDRLNDNGVGRLDHVG